MKRIVVAGILTMLVGCSTYTPARTTTPAPTVEPTPTFVEPTPTATPTAEPAPDVTIASPATTDPTVDEMFIDTVESQAGVDMDDDTLIQLGHDVCDLIGLVGFEEYAIGMAKEDVDPEHVGILTGASVVFYCPQYRAEAEAFVEKYR